MSRVFSIEEVGMVKASRKKVRMMVAAITANTMASLHSLTIDFFVVEGLRRKYKPKVIRPRNILNQRVCVRGVLFFEDMCLIEVIFILSAFA
jgi:RNase P/RNase MRP subunit POP5